MNKWIMIIGLLVWLSVPAQAAVAPLGEVVSTHKQPESMFAKWRSMLSRQAANDAVSSTCQRRDGHVCIPKAMLPKVRFKQGESDSGKLLVVNKAINRYRYRSDKSTWGNRDYWAAPNEFFAKGKGDCEDFAIAKYYVLRALGFAADDMRLVIVKDIKARDFHAVLAVSVDGVDYILDNRTNRLLVAEKQTYMKPIYALNTENWWLYKGASKWVKG
jgi:predicted transglutaminase-like cysteine proteinase